MLEQQKEESPFILFHGSLLHAHTRWRIPEENDETQEEEEEEEEEEEKRARELRVAPQRFWE